MTAVTTTRLDRALDLAAKGWHIFPLGDKATPLVKGWQNLATTDPAQLRAWWKVWPSAMPGLVPGRSGHCVIDIDKGHGSKSDGFEEAMFASVPTSAAVESVSSGGLGRHLYYAGHNRTGSNVNGIGSVDSRGDGGYVLIHDRYATLPEASAVTEPLPTAYKVAPSAPASASTGATVAQWESAMDFGPACEEVEVAACTVVAAGMSHQDLLDATSELAKHARTSGDLEIIESARVRYALGHDPRYLRAWDAALAGSADHFGLPHTVNAARIGFGFAPVLAAPALAPTPVPAAPTAAILARFPTLDVKAILDPHRPPRRWIWDGIAGRDDHTSIVAEGGTGKSLLVLGLTIALQREREDFIGRPISKPRRTLYLDLENSDDDWAERLTDLGVTEAEMTGWQDSCSLYVVPFPNFGGLDTAPGAKLLFGLIDALELTDGDLVVFDSTQRITRGEENSNDTGRALYEHTISELKRRHIASIRTDNTGKDVSKGARGGSAKRDDVANSWGLTVTENVYQLELDKKRSRGASDALAWKLDDSFGVLKFVPTARVTYSDKLRGAGKALDLAKVPHSMGVNDAWESVKAMPGGLHPLVTRDLVRKVQSERKAAWEAFK